MEQEFIYTKPPTPQCHASTLAETSSALVAAWFGGTHEKHPDVGIWVSRQPAGGAWTTPVQVATGVVAPGDRHPCWNPVLFQPETGPLLLFYKVGPNPAEWWGMMIRSADFRPGRLNNEKQPGHGVRPRTVLCKRRALSVQSNAPSDLSSVLT